MDFYFTAIAQQMLASGEARYMVSKAGELLPVLVNSHTGKIIEIARVAAEMPINPIAPITNLIEGAAQMYQIHRGFQKTYGMIEEVQKSLGVVQQSLGVLQTTTTIVGAGVAVTGALTAVNLYQTLQLRKDVKELRKDLSNGFLDLKQVLSGQHADILERLDQTTLEARRREFEAAYAKFTEALKLVGLAAEMNNSIVRDQHFANAVQMMYESLSIYNDPRLMPEMSAAERLRRAECAWIIESAIAYVFSLQNEPSAARTSLTTLREKIQRDSFEIVNACQSQVELDFIFPELMRIQSQDLAALKLWSTQIDVIQALPSSELEALPDLRFTELPEIEVLEVPEEVAYLELQSKSNFHSLRDQLRFKFKPQLRTEYETTIAQQATELGYSSFARSNWEDVSDLTVSNLFWYLEGRKNKGDGLSISSNQL
ncbi:hypothetical protein [Leptolyngbya sp. GGD]|uniref:hypothetical protein n=1 Tax=Leptolyngbya sp. GGD TaxID=2997907 RepID=UPI00227AD2C7|nr:hypothetical protein [Leptolyngbya sp. GGD]MCY6493175.1 hypothetical protein [Leptolyngbya sp. GGD]